MKRRGFATIMALILMALVVAALSAMAIAMHMEKMRTESAHTQAALRQLLAAGAADAVTRAKHWPATVLQTEWSVEMPPALTASEFHLSGLLKPVGHSQAAVQITATIQGHSAVQQVEFQRSNDMWTVKSIQLGQ